MQPLHAQDSQGSEHWVSSQDSEGYGPGLDLTAAQMAALDILEENYAAEIAANAPQLAVEVEAPAQRLSATNLAIYHHLNCDLYLHNAYQSRDPRQSTGKDKVVSAAADAQFAKGDIWEQRLFDSLESRQILKRVDDQTLLSSTDLAELFVSIDQPEVYVCGVTFNAPSFDAEFASHGTRPVAFSIAKPDLVKLSRVDLDGESAVEWEVIDAKSSKHVKTSHHVQIGWYAKCLSVLLPRQHRGVDIVASNVASVWLPPLGSRPQSVPLAHVFSALDDLIFRRLPHIVFSPRHEVPWHFNPLCTGCPWMTKCRANTVKQRTLGMIPNISPNEAAMILDVIPRDRSGTDIEELDKLFGNDEQLAALEQERPTSMRKVKKRLGLDGGATSSAVIRAARTRKAQVTKRRTFAFPRIEDVAVVVSVVLDASSRIESHRADVFAADGMPAYKPAIAAELVADLSNIIEWIAALGSAPRVQFYTFSRAEQAAIQQHLIDVALSAEVVSDGHLLSQVRRCIAALCDGAGVVSTMFQPTILKDLLADLLNKPSTYIRKAHLQECLRRLSLDPNGKVADLRERLNAHLETLKAGVDQKSTGAPNRTLGDLPRIVVIQDEVERLIAIPSPGFWGLPEAVSHVCEGAVNVASDNDLLVLVSTHEHEELLQALGERNAACHLLINSVRRMISGATQYPGTILLNDARPLPHDSFMDLCRHPALRKLFWMHQFEVISRMQDLWLSRRDGCPDAILLRYLHTRKDQKDQYFAFDVEEGALDLAAEREFGFFEWLLVEDSGPSDARIPTENYFDDLQFCSTLFGMGKVAAWDHQHPNAGALMVANISGIDVTPDSRLISLQAYPWRNATFRAGQTYRLTPRLIDFNFAKVMRALLALDWETRPDNIPPFVALLQDPSAFAQSVSDNSEELLKAEARTQKRLRELASLDVEGAAALVLKDSQHKATQRMIKSRLSVLWGPPGTGKTYTVALSLLRMVECNACVTVPRIFFVSAVTHAAIDAFRKKLDYLTRAYRSVNEQTKEYDIRWLDAMRVEHVQRGSEQKRVSDTYTTHVYCGTAYQLDNFARKYGMQCDAVFIDEGSQMGVGTAALVLRWLKPDSSKVILAGDHLQLGTIVAAQYPDDASPALFGSILDLIVDDDGSQSVAGTSIFSDTSSQGGPIVQILENFRLNPDLADFVSTIYKRRMRPMKSQTKHTAEGLRSLHSDGTDDGVAQFLAALGDAMLVKTQRIVTAPQRAYRPRDGIVDVHHHPTSLALLNLEVSEESGHASYESHVRCEAEVAARLINHLLRAFPNSTIFVATPHRVQRTAVKEAVAKTAASADVDAITEALGCVDLKANRPLNPPRQSPTKTPRKSPSKSPDVPAAQDQVIIDTVERLQGQEADIVICCLAHTHRPTLLQDLNFIFQRRRLNVAISRAKMLCIVISSRDVLRPPLHVLADPDTAKGYTFLRDYEQRAWTGHISL